MSRPNHFSVNLRTCVPGYLRFGTSEAAHDYELLVGKTRLAQRVPFAVAPMCTLTTRSRGILSAGDEVQVSDFEGHKKPAWRLLQDAFEGVVLEADAREPSTVGA